MVGMGVERTWLKGLFHDYYVKHPVRTPYDVSRREFGHGSLKKIDARHVSFENLKELNAFLQNVSPLYFSASVSEFVNPSAQPMINKGLLGSDLIYEFDADDTPTDCKLVHDSWSCTNCAASGKGRVLKCTSCSHGTALEEWVCPTCVNATKVQTSSLLNVLRNDFGFGEKECSINFSGSKGYHVHVRSSAIFSLPKSGRVELMDYLSLHEWDAASAGFVFDGKQFHCPRFSSVHGHSQRLLSALLTALESAPVDEWMILSGSSPRTLKPFLEDRSRLVHDVTSGVLPPLPGKKTEAFWNNVLGVLVSRLQLKIDRQTSGDIFKLIRVPDTLHGSTGLVAQSVPLDALPSFDPFSEAVGFSSLPHRKVFVKSCPTLRMGDFTLDSVSEKEVTVPGAVAVYLVGWGAASLR